MLIGGLAGALCFMPITATVLNGVEPEHAGGASGMLQTTQQLGSAVGVAVIVSVYAAGAVPGEFLPGAQAAFLTSALFSAVAALDRRHGVAPRTAPGRRTGVRRRSRRSPSPTPPEAASAPAGNGCQPVRASLAERAVGAVARRY